MDLDGFDHTYPRQRRAKTDAFIVKNTSGIEKVPPNVRHLSILSSSGVKFSDLMSLGKHTKLRTLLCSKSFRNQTSSLMDRWFDELGCLRVFFCAFKITRLPERIGNLKHLRYLGISRNCHFIEVPSSFWSLYNLQILYARKCTFQRLHLANKLINLQKFESRVLEMKVNAAELGEQIGFINSFPDIKDLVIYNLGTISKDHAAKVEFRKTKDLNSLSLNWFQFGSPVHNEIEVLQALQPPTNVESVHIEGYPGEYFTTWFSGSDGLNAMPFSGTNLSSVTKLSIQRCLNLSDCTLQPICVPGMKKIEITDCTSVKSVRIEHFEGSTFLEELKVYNCPNITYLLAPCIRKLEMKNSGSLGDSNDCRSLTISSALTELSIEGCQNLSDCRLDVPAIRKIEIVHCRNVKSVRIEHLEDSSSSLEELKVYDCPNIRYLLAPPIRKLELKNSGSRKLELKNSGSLGDNNDFSSLTISSALTELSIEGCQSLSDCTLQSAYVAGIQKLEIAHCTSLKSVRIEHFEGSTSPEELKVYNCPNITYLLALSIKKLELKNSGSLGDCNDCSSLTILSSSLTELSIEGCQNLSDCTLDVPAIRKIEIAHCRNIKSVQIEHLEDSTCSLEELKLHNCPNITQHLLAPSIRKLLLENSGNSTCSLEELKVYNCPNITQHLLAPSIRKLLLENSGNLGDSINCSSLTILHLSFDLTSIDLQKWRLPLLQELKISNCPCLISVRDSEQVPPTDLSLGGARRRSTGKFPFLTHLTIEWCYNLQTLDGLLTHEYLPAIKELTIRFTPRLNWQSGMVLPSSIQKLKLWDCGNIIRSSLGNLTSLLE